MTVLEEALQHNRSSLQQFKYLTRVKVSARLFSRNIYTSYAMYKIIIHGQDKVSLHDGFHKHEIDIASANICLDNELTTMSLLIQHLVREHFSNHKVNDDKFSIEFYIASNQKLDNCKNSFIVRDIMAKEAANTRKK